MGDVLQVGVTLILVFGFFALFFYTIYYLLFRYRQRPRTLSPKELQDKKIICPHCQTRGFVTTERVKRKSGIHGGKATAALLTAGVSLLGTGLSQKNTVTEAHCSNCGTTWHF